jgi:hypothetical protein
MDHHRAWRPESTTTQKSRRKGAEGDRSDYRWGAWYEVENIQSPVVDLLNIRYLVTRKPMDTGQTPSRFELRAALPGMWVYENSAVLPRFFMVHKVRPVRFQIQQIVHQVRCRPRQAHRYKS